MPEPIIKKCHAFDSNILVDGLAKVRKKFLSPQLVIETLAFLTYLLLTSAVHPLLRHVPFLLP